MWMKLAGRLLVVGALSCTVLFGAPALGNRAGAASLTPPVGLAGYTVSLFASGTANYSNPDSVVVDSQVNRIYVGYQNHTAKDGTDSNTSTIVEYGTDGSVIRTVAIPGHNDGLRVDPSTHLLWATSNEDGNPAFVTIDPFTGTVTHYHFPPACSDLPGPCVPHGGGFDDIFFLNGVAYVVASNPTLDANGVNDYPAVYTMQLMFDHGIFLSPVLKGNEKALDTTTGQTVTLNEVDPDSLSVDDQGNLVLVNQGGSELVFLHNPFSTSRSVTRVPVGTQLDDTVWATSTSGSLLVVDGTQNAIWKVSSSTFTPGTVYTEAPNDSGVVSFVGTVDLSTGAVRPVIIGFGKPTGMTFIPGS